jgi:gluconolactonase
MTPILLSDARVGFQDEIVTKIAVLFVLGLVGAAGGAAQDFSDLTVERGPSNFRFTEGPAWSGEFLLFSDIPSNRILKITPGQPAVTIFREDSGGANGNAFDNRGRLYTCEGGNRRVTRTTPDGKVEVLAERFEGKRFNAPNDITVRRDGHAYFTDPAYGPQEETRELPFYGVFHLTPRGQLNVVARMDKRPNGITLSPDGRTLYVAGADERVVRMYDLDRGGNATNGRILISGIEGVPDGIRTDEKGNLYVAAQGVQIYSPSGQLLREIKLPETPSNLEFGDGDLRGLYITARRSVYYMRLPVKGAAQR